MSVMNRISELSLGRRILYVIAALIVVIALLAGVAYMLHRITHPAAYLGPDDRYETTHWIITSPITRDKITKWQIFSKRDGENPVSCYIEFFPSYPRMAISIRRHTELGCTYQEFRIDKEPHRYYKSVGDLGEWTWDDCTRCCPRSRSEDHPDLLKQISPYFNELPAEVKDDLRPYLKAAGYEL
jgi:hypothetical protein